MAESMYRQGDVLLIEISDKYQIKSFIRNKKKMKTRTNNVLAYGEITGHAHKVAGEATVFEEATDRLLVEVTGTAEVTHEEHDTIPLPKGLYRVVHQTEHAPERESRTRRVVD